MKTTFTLLLCATLVVAFFPRPESLDGPTSKIISSEIKVVAKGTSPDVVAKVDTNGLGDNPSHDPILDTATNWEEMLPSATKDGKETILAMPGTRFGTLGKVDERPVLPLDWDDAPYPNEAHPDINKFLDKRAKNAKKDRAKRYLRSPPKNVDANHVVKGTRAKSFVDHPRVQPRTHRSQHYQLRVANKHKVPDSRMLNPAKGNPQLSSFPSLPRTFPRHNLFATFVKTATGMYPKVNPFSHPPGTNMLPTVYQNMRDRRNAVIPNTLPSHPNNPYNLHDGLPEVIRLKTLSSPGDDLNLITDEIFELLTGIPRERLWEDLDGLTMEKALEMAEAQEENIEKHRDQLLRLSQWALDIIEGNAGNGSKVPANRAYRGFPLLNHSGHRLRNKRAIPIYGRNGKIIGANIDVHQIWYGGRIQSDTMFYDFGWDDVSIDVKTQSGVDRKWFSTYDSNWNWDLIQLIPEYAKLLNSDPNAGTQKHYPFIDLTLKPGDKDYHVHRKFYRLVSQLEQQPEPIPSDVPWTVTYTIDVLNRGEDDFSPTQVYFDDVERIDFADDNLNRKFPAYKIFDESTGKNELVRMGPPHIAMDQTFFPMQEGTRTKLKIKMAPPKYSNVTYTWGWRNHPPRAQAVENSHKRIPPMADEMLVRIALDKDGRLSGPEMSAKSASKPSSDHFLRRHESFPDLPPFGRLRISDHERFTFEGIHFEDSDPLYGVSTLDDEVLRYLPEREQWLRNRLGGSPSPQALRNELKSEFRKLGKAPFFHPLPSRPEHVQELLKHIAELGKTDEVEPRRKAYNKQFWGILDQLNTKPVFSDALWIPKDDPRREKKISPMVLAETKRTIVNERLRTNHKVVGPISRLGDLAPAKRMWRSFLSLKNIYKYETGHDLYKSIRHLLDARDAFLDWQDRNHLPSGIRPDKKSDFTLIYLNNTLYGESIHGGLQFDEWVVRSEDPENPGKQKADLKLTVLNGDYFLHGYINPDFGGNRGWENQFKPTLALGGSGSFFTFGRFNWRFNSEPGAIGIPPAVRTDANGHDIVIPFENRPEREPPLSPHGEPIYDGSLSPGIKPFPHRVWIRFNYEPSRRLRFYQFDPLHHDAAIFSIH